MFNDLWKGVQEKSTHDIMQEYIHKFLVILLLRGRDMQYFIGGREGERQKEVGRENSRERS